MFLGMEEIILFLFYFILIWKFFYFFRKFFYFRILVNSFILLGNSFILKFLLEENSFILLGNSFILLGNSFIFLLFYVTSQWEKILLFWFDFDFMHSGLLPWDKRPLIHYSPFSEFYADISNQHHMQQYKSCLNSFL